MNEEKLAAKKCPYCKEEVKIDAIVCKYCKNKLDLGSKMISFGNKLTGIGCALTLLVMITILLLGLL